MFYAEKDRWVLKAFLRRRGIAFKRRETDHHLILHHIFFKPYWQGMLYKPGMRHRRHISAWDLINIFSISSTGTINFTVRLVPKETP